MAGAPVGNKNAVKSKPWAEAIDRAIKRDRDALDRLARKLIAMAAEGDMTAMKELGDRLDGKPKQQVEMSGEDGGPLALISSNITDAQLIAFAARFISGRKNEVTTADDAGVSAQSD